MRRADRECSDREFIAQVLQNADTLFLALLNHGAPYCIPVNFAPKDQALFIHCATSGLKLDCIAQDPRVAFSAAIDIEIDRKKYTTWYKSIAGHGLASLLSDPAEKQAALDLIGSRYNALCPRPAPPAAVARVAIIRIDITEIWGKRHWPRPEA